MNRLSIIFILIITMKFSYGQFDCYVDDDLLKSSGLISNSSDYIPDSNTEMKYLRVNIHFILKSASDPNYPGNFSATDDGNGNSNYTGYDYAEDIISTANLRLQSNVLMFRTNIKC